MSGAFAANAFSYAFYIGVASVPGPLQVLSEACQATTDGAPCSGVYVGVAFPDDQFINIELLQLNTGGTIRMLLRINSGATYATLDGYTLLLEDLGGGFMELIIGTYVSGDLIIIDSIASLAYTETDDFIFAAVDSTLYVFQNDVQILTVVDETYSSGGIGLVLEVAEDADLTSVRVANFIAGSVTVA